MSVAMGSGGDTPLVGPGPVAAPRLLVTGSTHPSSLSALRRHRHARPVPFRRSDAERVTMIRGMIADRALEIHLQPIIDLRTGETVGAEALSRFAPLPVRPPDAWFAEAATLGVGVELELAALAMALEGLDRLPSGMYLSVNVSAETMVSTGFRAVMDAVPPERIVLELTEHTRVADYRAFVSAVEPLRSAGMRLAVDDAGSGFASFNHVLELRPEVIKLDISLIRGIDLDPAKQALARALLGFGAEALDTTFVAEGIETRGELDALRRLGFQNGQGFILGRPSRHLGTVRPWPRTTATSPLQDAPGSVETTDSNSGPDGRGRI